MASIRSKMIAELIKILKIKYKDVDPSTRESFCYKKKPSFTMSKKYNVEPSLIDGFNVFTISKNKELNNKTIVLYLHGGSYVYTYTAFHWQFLDRLMSDSDICLVTCDYPLAPENNYLTTSSMVYKLYLETIEKYPNNKIVIMGDSAGGGLSLVLTQMLKANAVKQPEELILLSPWLDLTMTNPLLKTIDNKDAFLDIASLSICAGYYSNNTDLTNPLLSPIYGDLELSCRVSIFSGTYDILNADMHLLNSKMKGTSTEYYYYEYPEMFHCFMLVKLPESEDVLLKIKNLLTNDCLKIQ